MAKRRKKREVKKKEKRKDEIVIDKMEWIIGCDVAPTKGNTYLSRVFYARIPGYRLQMLAKIDQTEGDIFFCFKVLKGVYDEKLNGSCQQGITVKVSKKWQSSRIEFCWFIPEKDVLIKPVYILSG